MFILIVFIAGIVVGTIFHAVFTKWYNKGKATAKELAHDVEVEAGKLSKKP
jgi:hypothetical protein